jgi:hypothetical protein
MMFIHGFVIQNGSKIITPSKFVKKEYMEKFETNGPETKGHTNIKQIN